MQHQRGKKKAWDQPLYTAVPASSCHGQRGQTPPQCPWRRSPRWGCRSLPSAGPVWTKSPSSSSSSAGGSPPVSAPSPAHRKGHNGRMLKKRMKEPSLGKYLTGKHWCLNNKLRKGRWKKPPTPHQNENSYKNSRLTSTNYTQFHLLIRAFICSSNSSWVPMYTSGFFLLQNHFWLNFNMLWNQTCTHTPCDCHSNIAHACVYQQVKIVSMLTDHLFSLLDFLSLKRSLVDLLSQRLLWVAFIRFDLYTNIDKNKNHDHFDPLLPLLSQQW